MTTVQGPEIAESYRPPLPREPEPSRRSESPSSPGAWSAIGWGAAALAASGALAVAIEGVHRAFGDSPHRAVMVTAVMCALLVGATAGVALLAWRRAADGPLRILVATLAAVGVVLSGITLFWLGHQIAFPADFLIWSESDFVNDIIKFRAGYPLYTAQANNESFNYMPGAQLLSYGLASLVGAGTSLTALRAAQLLYTIAAAVVALMCVRRILALSGVTLRAPRLWAAAWLTALFLAATNPVTNGFIVELHNDSLAQLVSLVGFWACLEYGATSRRGWLVVMALVPLAGFLVKQSVVIWAGLGGLFLLLAIRPVSFRRLVLFGAVAFGLPLLAALGGILLWGESFRYWTITVLGQHGVDPLRSIQHVVDSWLYFAGGIAGAMLLIRGPHRRTLFAAAVVWLLFLGAEAYTSGVAWMLNHLGPGSLIAGIWLVAGATALVESQLVARRDDDALARWLRPAAMAALAVLVFMGLGVVRIPVRPFSPDAYRYVRDIEREVGEHPRDVLLDAGSWVYLPDTIIMKDRAPSIGERGWSNTGDFSGLLERIRGKRYSKILVRNYHAPDFWYDATFWPVSSGARAALEENYREVATIPAAQVQEGQPPLGYLFADISVLVPRGP